MIRVDGNELVAAVGGIAREKNYLKRLQMAANYLELLNADIKEENRQRETNKDFDKS